MLQKCILINYVTFEHFRAKASLKKCRELSTVSKMLIDERTNTSTERKGDGMGESNSPKPFRVSEG